MTTVSNQLMNSLDRQHILAGRLIAILRRDELLRLICLSDRPGKMLASELELTQKQADDILNLNLGYFKRTKVLEIEDELNDLKVKVNAMCLTSMMSDS